MLDIDAARPDELLIVMELVEGVSLARWLLRQQPTWRAILDRVVQVGRGLTAAHAACVVHGGLTPRRVLITEDGRALLTGLASARARADAALQTAEERRNAALADTWLESHEAEDARVTGDELAALDLLAPEQRRGLPPDERTDVYQLCRLLDDALAGHAPSSRGARADPVPTWLRDRVRRGLQADPRRRWPSVAAFLRAVEDNPERARARRRRQLAVAGSLAAIAGALVLTRQQRARQCVERGALSSDWDEDARASARRAFAGSSAPGRATSWARVEGRLDHWARLWTREHRALCRDDAALTRRVDRRSATCLEEQRAQFRELVKLLREADRNVVAHAIDAADAVDPPSLCRDSVWLDARGEPHDPASARAPDDGLLPRIRMYARSGQHARALRLLDPLLTAADERARLEPLLLAGALEDAIGRDARAESRLREAWLIGQKIGRTLAAAEAASLLARLHAVRSRDAEVVRWRARADALYARAGLAGHPAIVDHLLRMAELDASAGRPDAARERKHAALALLERALGADAPRVAALRVELKTP